jgi:hypothetical protein
LEAKEEESIPTRIDRQLTKNYFPQSARSCITATNVGIQQTQHRTLLITSIKEADNLIITPSSECKGNQEQLHPQQTNLLC